MRLITRDTGYAVAALCYIVQHKMRKVSVSELAKSLKIPKHFLRKIMQVLNKKGILHSYKGQGGGFMLTRASSKIFLVDLITIFQGKIKLSECISKKKECPRIKNCRLKEKIEDIQNYIISELKDITLASLLGKQGKIRERIR